ncbi:MAG: ACP S-malonyltransferase [Planctomycetes bacterium]|nr:ACP S-malonyltransferase [Planctomycetota bacterium]
MSALPTAVLFCPGRGSYGREELGSLQRWLRPDGAVARALAHAGAERVAAGEPTVRELDAAPAFKPGLHLQGRNAAELIWFTTLAALETLRTRYRIVAIAGNSLGWYTALPAAGVLDPLDGWRLIDTMARLQATVAGGQILTSCVDGEWRHDAEAAAEVARALDQVNARGADHFVARSIRLGGHEVLAGTEAGVQALLATLRRRKVGEREFPFRLAGHGPFHTPLCAGVAEAALPVLTAFAARRPDAYLIDGRGLVHSPWSADPAELLRYTAGEQVVTTFDFTACVRIALREFQPDVLLCAPPGTSLRAPVGHVVLRERWRGLATREALFAANVIRTE